MKRACVKKLFGFLVVALVIAISSCKKQDSMNELPQVINEPAIDTRIKFPPVPRIPLPLAKCIFSYQDILGALGSNSVKVSAVVLANGITIRPGADLNAITYEAVQASKSNSLFDSRLVVEWRWPGGNWQLSTADVWSLGCGLPLTPSNGGGTEPPYTNLIKAGDTILINTCFYWSTNEYTGERIDYLIID